MSQQVNETTEGNMKDTFTEIMKKLRINRHNPVPDEYYTDWIKAILQAEIVALEPTAEWNDNGDIQVKTMGEEDLLQDSKVQAEFMEDEDMQDETPHAYDQRLDVIKLPIPIPGPKLEVSPQFLFIRPDEYQLFKCFGITEWCILTGNPGISKSWFQWKFILLCYRPDLLDRLWSKGKQGATKSEEVGNLPSKRLKVSVSVKQMAKPSLKESKPCIPDLIVRTVGGHRSLLFFVNRPYQDVLYLEHNPGALHRFTNEKCTILWEPGETTNPVAFTDCVARIIATVSPNQDRFKEFQKNGATMFYMPCPSELQLRLMGQILRSAGNDCPTDEEIHDRVKKYGPFIQVALNWDKVKIDSFHALRQGEITRICATEKTLSHTLQSPIHIMRSTERGLSGLSHRLVHYQVRRDSATLAGGYDWPHYGFNSDEVHNLISNEIRKSSIETVKEHLVLANQADIDFRDT